VSEDRRTKAQILAELEKAKEQISEMLTRIPREPVRVPEADALAGCIRSLDSIKDQRSYGYGNESSSAVRRTILALCEKYGVERFEKVTEPCTRRHVEDLSAADVLSAVKRDFEGMFPLAG
jgi:hypothetical protein